MVHVELIDTYNKSIRHQQPGGATTKRDVSLTCMRIIYPTTGLFEIFEVLMFDHDEVTGVKNEYIDN